MATEHNRRCYGVKVKSDPDIRYYGDAMVTFDVACRMAHAESRLLGNGPVEVWLKPARKQGVRGRTPVRVAILRAAEGVPH